MLLENRYYRVLDVRREDETTAVYRVELLPECDVYRGHFPGNPVSPGVCNIEMIKECAMLFAGRRLFLSGIKRCRLTAVSSPMICPIVEVYISVLLVDNVWRVTAKVADNERIYVEYQGEMVS